MCCWILLCRNEKTSAHTEVEDELIILQNNKDEVPEVTFDEKSERLERNSEPEDRIEFVPDYNSGKVDNRHYRRGYYEERRVELIMGEVYDLIYRTPVEFNGYNKSKVVDVAAHYQTVGYEQKQVTRYNSWSRWYYYGTSSNGNLAIEKNTYERRIESKKCTKKRLWWCSKYEYRYEFRTRTSYTEWVNDYSKPIKKYVPTTYKYVDNIYSPKYKATGAFAYHGAEYLGGVKAIVDGVANEGIYSKSVSINFTNNKKIANLNESNWFNYNISFEAYLNGKKIERFHRVTKEGVYVLEVVGKINGYEYTTEIVFSIVLSDNTEVVDYRDENGNIIYREHRKTGTRSNVKLNNYPDGTVRLTTTSSAGLSNSNQNTYVHNYFKDKIQSDSSSSNQLSGAVAVAGVAIGGISIGAVVVAVGIVVIAAILIEDILTDITYGDGYSIIDQIADSFQRDTKVYNNTNKENAKAASTAYVNDQTIQVTNDFFCKNNKGTPDTEREKSNINTTWRNYTEEIGKQSGYQYTTDMARTYGNRLFIDLGNKGKIMVRLMWWTNFQDRGYQPYYKITYDKNAVGNTPFKNEEGLQFFDKDGNRVNYSTSEAHHEFGTSIPDLCQNKNNVIEHIQIVINKITNKNRSVATFKEYEAIVDRRSYLVGTL